MTGGFTKSETASLLKALHQGMQGKIEAWMWNAFSGWARAARQDTEFLQLILEGYLVPVFDPDGELRFMSTEKGRASKRAAELERIGS